MQNSLENNAEQSIEILLEMQDFWFSELNEEIISSCVQAISATRDFSKYTSLGVL